VRRVVTNLIHYYQPATVNLSLAAMEINRVKALTTSAPPQSLGVDNKPRMLKKKKDKWKKAHFKLQSFQLTKEEYNDIENIENENNDTTIIQRSKSTTSGSDQVTKALKWLKKSFFEQEICVLVSDLSGFTRLTRKYGVIHFASVIIRKRQLCLPILHKYGALFISTEADNFIVVMPSAVAGAKAANEMQSVIFKYNSTLPPEREHFKIILNGIGLDCGIGVAIDRDDKLHGEVSNTAYHIGEDLCSNGSVLCSGRMITRLNEAKDISGNWEICDGVQVEQGAEGESVYEIQSIENAPIPDVVDSNDNRFLHPNLLPFAQRHNLTVSEEVIINTLDVEIKKHEQTFTALMFEFEMEKLAMKSGAEATLTLKFQAMDVLKPILLKFNAIPLEDVLYVFTSPSDALAAALASKQMINEFNMENRRINKNELEISGFGLHTGTIVFVKGTDIHWGDPVNTSSKLGQDIAKNGTILISNIVKEGIEKERLTNTTTSTYRSPFQKMNVNDDSEDGATKMIDLEYKHQIVTVSKVDLDCYNVIPSDNIYIPTDSDVVAMDEQDIKEEEQKVVLLAEHGVHDTSRHPAQDAEEEINKCTAIPFINDTIHLNTLTNECIKECNTLSPGLTPANTPARPNMPWLKQTVSPPKRGTSGMKLNQSSRLIGSESRALATATYTHIPRISYDHEWSPSQKRSVISTFGQQDSPAGSKRRTRNHPPKERESVLTQQRKALSLANDVLKELELENLKKEKKIMKKKKEIWHQKLISSSLYGSPKMKAEIYKMTKRMNANRPGSAHKGTLKPKRPSSSLSKRTRRKRPNTTQGGGGGGGGGRSGKHMKYPNNNNDQGDDSDMPLINDDLFTQFLSNKHNDDYNPARYEAELKMIANDARMKLLEAQNSADAAKSKLWTFDKKHEGTAYRKITSKIAKTQKCLSLCSRKAEEAHRKWLIEMTRNVRAITHADIDRVAPDQLPEEEFKNIKSKILSKRADDAQKEHMNAMNSYMNSLTRRKQKKTPGSPLSLRASPARPSAKSIANFEEELHNTKLGGIEQLPDRAIYLERAKKLRLMKKLNKAKNEKQRRYEHDHGKNPRQQKVSGIIRRRNKCLYFPIGSQGTRDWERRCSLKDALIKFKDITSAYAMEYDQMKGLACIKTLNSDGVRGTFTLKTQQHCSVYLRKDKVWKTEGYGKEVI
jgi:class 3 adenylate cyclase